MFTIRRKINTAGHRVVWFVVEFRWTLLGLVVVAVGIISMIAAIPYPILVAEAFFSVLLIATDIAKNRREARRTRFLSRPHDSFDDVIERLAGDDNFVVLVTPGGTFVHDRAVSERMRSHQQFVQLARHSYVLPPQLRPQARRFLKFVLANNRRFNGPCIGWNADLAKGGDIEVVAGDHFGFVQSDELAMWDVAVDGRLLPEFGRSLFIQRGGTVRNYRDSWLFNLIGASTIAITTDGRLVCVQQSAANMASQNLLAPSGSGSVEPQDFKGANRLTVAQLAINAATRELSEEAGISPGEMECSHLLGYGRWLDKAARGELLCVTFLNINSHEVKQKRIHPAERTYTERSNTIRFSQALSDWNPARPGGMLPLEDRSRMSIPLAAALSLLADEASEPKSPVRGRLLRLQVGPSRR